jgi:hypothetical protein
VGPSGRDAAASGQAVGRLQAGETLSGQDITAVASALTWLGERLCYLAATGTPPFDKQDRLISTLLLIWTSVRYQA